VKETCGVNIKLQGLRSTNREKKLSHFVATFQGHQKVIRKGLKGANEFRKGAEELLSKLPVGSKGAIANVQFQISLAGLLQYMFLLSHDLSCLVEEMICTRSRWKKKLYARLVALTMYECSNDFAFLLGKPFREQLINLHLTYRDADRKTIHKELIEFNRSRNAFLKKIRNSVIGHREHDGKTQIEVIQSLKPMQIYRLVHEYYQWYRKLWQFLLIPIINDLRAIVASANEKLMILNKSREPKNG
jgi:hypothetical protein